MSDVYRYFSGWKTKDFDCPECHWDGKGSALVPGELGDIFSERRCPKCYHLLAMVLFPTFKENRANWDRLSLGEREHMERAETFQAEFDRRKLRHPRQLPFISDGDFTLTWDQGPRGDTHSETLIKHRNRVIFAEPALYEGYDRFIKVAAILRSRYKNALRDLIPTERSEVYLYGDYGPAPEKVKEARQRIFGR